MREEKQTLEQTVEEARKSKPESVCSRIEQKYYMQEERSEYLRQYDELKKKKEELTTKLESLRERDPETIRIMSMFCCRMEFIGQKMM